MQEYKIEDGRHDRREWRGKGGGRFMVKAPYSEAKKISRSSAFGGAVEQDTWRFEGPWNSHAPFKA